MSLQSPRFAGDPILAQCLAGTFILQASDAPESDEVQAAIGKVQQALIDLGYPLPVLGANGRFGSETGDAVSAFKVDAGLDPPDPRVETGTTAALDGAFAGEAAPAEPVPDPAPAAAAQAAIILKIGQLASAGFDPGNAIDTVPVPIPGTSGFQQQFSNATLFWELATGAWELHGELLTMYFAAWWPNQLSGVSHQ